MWEYNHTDELYHHGVKGMKWGVRKKKEDRYVSRFQARRNASKAVKESRQADIKNGVSSISTMQRHATLAKAKSKLADAEHNQKLREERSAYRKERMRQNRYLFTKRAIDVGTAMVNKYLKDHDTTLNGRPLRVSNKAKTVVNTMLNYKYMKDTLNK